MTKKAIIVTYADRTQEEKTLLNTTNIFKVGVNFYGDESVDYRLFYDYMLIKEHLDNCTTPLVTSYHLKCCPDTSMYKNHPQVKLIFDVAPLPYTSNMNELYFNTSSLIPAIDFALKYGGAEKILLVADNRVHGDRFAAAVNKAIKLFKPYVEMFKYRADANFFLKHKTIQEFIGA